MQAIYMLGQPTDWHLDPAHWDGCSSRAEERDGWKHSL